MIELLVETDAHEGPVYAPDEHALYFTTSRPHVSIRRLSLADRTLTTAREDANAANGMALDHEGRLVICEQGSRTRPAAITRMDRRTGAVETVVDGWDGKPLNSPNDVIVARDGALWFTDPSYGHLQGFRPPPAAGDHVYRYDGELTVVGAFDKPNGLALSPAEDVLYVAARGVLFALDGGRRVLAEFEPGHPDGVKVDAAGRIYATFPGGIRVLNPDGAQVGEIALPGVVNFTWGGPGRLYATTDTAVWAADLKGTP